MQEKRSAKQNGPKCRAQQVSAEAAPSTSGRKKEYGNEPDSLIHCGDGGTRSKPEADGMSRRDAVVKKGRADPRKMLVAQRRELDYRLRGRRPGLDDYQFCRSKLREHEYQPTKKRKATAAIDRGKATDLEATLESEKLATDVPQAHGVHANQVFKWRCLYREGRLNSVVDQATRWRPHTRVARNT